MDGALMYEIPQDVESAAGAAVQLSELTRVSPDETGPKQPAGAACGTSHGPNRGTPPHPLIELAEEAVPINEQDSSVPTGTQAETNNSSPKKSRRVYFPHDGSVVSGYMDPPNPWHDAESCSTEELVCAYKIACDKHNVKPIPKLLSQLHAVSDFCDRNETLTLKGERLDHKHSETLEEVLRRVQFRTIDLEATHLDEEGAVALFDMIEYYESGTKINISYNKNIGPRGWQACSRMLKKTPCVESLDARACALTDQVMPMLGRAIRLGSHLCTLHLESTMISGRPLMILVAAVKMNEILRELFLADNKLMPSDGIQLGNMLKYNHRLQLLDVRNNHLQDVGTGHLCDGLYEQNLGVGLATLVLWNNQVTYQAMPSMARALMSTGSMETLNLGHNNITNEGIHRLKDGLLQNKSLLRLGLQAAKISCEGAVALAEFIADSPRLLRIDLRENDIKTGGLMALSLSLKVSESVTRIDIDKDPKKENAVKDYAEQQRRLHQDIAAFMQRNRDLARQREEAEEQERIRAEEQQRLREEEEKRRQEEEERNKAEEMEAGEAARRGEHLHLSLPIPSRTKTLESPAFTPAASIPWAPPPTEEEVASEVAAQSAAMASQDIPVEFPPSPMAGHIKSPLLDPIPEDGAGTAKPPSPSCSPNTRRKFIISRVRESEELPTPDSEHSTPDEDVFLPIASDPIPVTSEPNQMNNNLEAALEVDPDVACEVGEVSRADEVPGGTSACDEQTGEQETTNDQILMSQVNDFVSQLVQDAAVEIQDEGPGVPCLSAPAVSVESSSENSPDPGAVQEPALVTVPDSIQTSIGPAGPSPSHSQTHYSSDSLSGSQDNPSGVGTENKVSEDTSGAQDSVAVTSGRFCTELGVENGGAENPASGASEQIPEEISTVSHNNGTSAGPVQDSTSANGDSLEANDNGAETLAKPIPDFHTNLSLNGMKTELASVLDSLEHQVVPIGAEAAAKETECTSSPDEFEAELDAMLASVQRDLLPLPIMDSSHKLVEEILAEAVDQQ